MHYINLKYTYQLYVYHDLIKSVGEHIYYYYYYYLV